MGRGTRWAIVLAAGCGRLGFTSVPGDRDSGAADVGDVGDVAASDAAPACLASYARCDGFEGNSIDPAWMPDPLITIDSTRAHRGASSVHVQSPAIAAGTDDYTVLADQATLATIGTTFWVRAWLWLSALPAGMNGLELITAQRPSAGGDYLFVFSNRTDVYTQYDGVSQQAMVAVPVGGWFCAVFKVVRSTTSTGSIEASGDIPMLVLPGVQTDGVPPLEYITLGLAFSAPNVAVPQPVMDLWIDDVIIDDAAVTCAD